MLSLKKKKKAFEKVALAHVESVYRFAVHLCGNESDAEDLMQECFHQAYRKFHQFQEGTNCKAWLFRILRNMYIDWLRKKAREPNTSELRDLAIGNNASDREASLLEWGKLDIKSDQVIELFGDEVNRYLRELPQLSRLAVVLCDVENLSYSEIGTVMDCPIGTVRSRIARARNFLKEKLYGYAKDHGFVKEEN